MGHRVKIEPSGHEFEAADAETILAAALRAGVMLPYSCRNGNCGTCKGTLKSGEIDFGVYEAKALSAAERAAGQALFCRAVPRSDVVVIAREIAAAKDIAVKILPCRVAKMQRLAPDVMALYLKPPQAERLQFLAGQYIDILLRDGRRRSFSLANAPQDDEFLQLHIRHVPGGHFSNFVFTEMQEKTLLRFEGPLGTFFLREDSERPIVLVAGGTGFAPIKGILEHAFHIGLMRPLHLFWGARTRVDLYLHELVLGWEMAHANFRYTPVLSAPHADDAWTGATGYVHAAVATAYADLSAHDVYASGPPQMIAAATVAFTQRGLLRERFYFDSFDFASDPAAASG